MKADAIFRVTEAIREKLRAAVKESGVPGSVFVGPLDDADSNGAALILFLYRIVPNSNLRNLERRVESESGSVDTYRNSLPLDLYYLISVGSIANSSEEIPLRTLGYAMREMQTKSVLTIQGPRLQSETVRITLEPLTTEESSRIWALFPAANYRTSVAYLVSPVWIDPEVPEAEGMPVTIDRLRAGSKAQVPV
jgi:hypothetical protein